MNSTQARKMVLFSCCSRQRSWLSSGAAKSSGLTEFTRKSPIASAGNPNEFLDRHDEAKTRRCAGRHDGAGEEQPFPGSAGLEPAQAPHRPSRSRQAEDAGCALGRNGRAPAFRRPHGLSDRCLSALQEGAAGCSRLSPTSCRLTFLSLIPSSCRRLLHPKRPTQPAPSASPIAPSAPR